MGLLQKIRGRLLRSLTKAAPAASVSGMDYAKWLESSSPAMRISTFYRCVRLLSETVANLPLQYLCRQGGIFVENDRGSFPYLLNVQPSPNYSAFDFWRQAVAQIYLHGNSYIIPIYNPASLELDYMILCSPGSVTHDYLNDRYTVHDSYNQISGVYDESEIIHLKGVTLNNPKNGLSVLSFARMTMAIAGTSESETLNRFATGGNVRGIVTGGTVRGFGEFQDNELDKLAQSLEVDTANRRIVSIPGAVSFSQTSLSSSDMQFLESRKFTVREICRFFGVHPSFVFDDTSNNYKSAEQANMAFLSMTLAPLLRSIENELHRKLIAPSLAANRMFKFDRKGLYTCDLESMAKFRSLLLQTGSSVNEVRQMDNRPPVEGGDRVFISQNLKGIDETTYPAQSAPNPSTNDNGDNN